MEVKVPGTLSRGLNVNSCFVCIVYLVSIGNISAYLKVVTTVISTCIDYSSLLKNVICLIMSGLLTKHEMTTKNKILYTI